MASESAKMESVLLPETREFSEVELKIMYGLTAFLHMDPRSISDFFRDVIGKKIGRKSIISQLRLGQEKFSDEAFLTEERFASILFEVSSKSPLGVLDISEIAARYPGRIQESPWTKEEGELLTSLHQHTGLTREEIVNVMNDVYPARQHNLGVVAFKSRVARHRRKNEDVIDKSELEKRLNLSIDNIHFLYQTGESSRKNLFSPDEKIVVLGFLKYFKTSTSSLFHFIRDEMGRTWIRNHAYPANMRHRFQEEREEIGLGDISQSDFERAIMEVLKQRGKQMSLSEIKEKYSDAPPITKAILSSLVDGSIQTKIKLSPRALRILRLAYVDKMSHLAIAEKEAVTVRAVSRVLTRTRVKMRTHLDTASAVTVEIRPEVAEKKTSESITDTWLVDRKKRTPVLANALLRYKNLSASRGVAQLWSMLEKKVQDSASHELPLAVRVRDAQITHTTPQGQMRLFKIKHITVVAPAISGGVSKSEREKRECLRGLGYYVSLPTTIETLFRKAYQKDDTFEGVEIVVSIDTNYSNADVFSQRYINPKALGRPIVVHSPVE